MAGAAVTGIFGAAAAAPLVRLLMDAREIAGAHGETGGHAATTGDDPARAAPPAVLPAEPAAAG